jgi:histone-lysine N-methyltransferase SETMAR
MLHDKFTPAIQTKRRELVSKGLALLHDNSRPHTAAHTLESLRHLNFEVLEHPPYSPDLTLLDQHLFGPLKPALRGRHFASDHELKEVVHVRLVTQPKTFLSEGIQKLVSC